MDTAEAPRPAPAPEPPLAHLAARLAAVSPPPAPSMPLSQALKVWLAERAKKNAPRTLDAKRFHITNFLRHVGDVRINELSKPVIVGFKTARLAEGRPARRWTTS